MNSLVHKHRPKSKKKYFGPRMQVSPYNLLGLGPKSILSFFEQNKKQYYQQYSSDITIVRRCKASVFCDFHDDIVQQRQQSVIHKVVVSLTFCRKRRGRQNGQDQKNRTNIVKQQMGEIGSRAASGKTSSFLMATLSTADGINKCLSV